MTQVFEADGTAVPVTVVQAGPCLVVQKKTADRDGYESIQIGLVDARPDRSANRPREGAVRKGGRRADAHARGSRVRRRATSGSPATRSSATASRSKTTWTSSACPRARASPGVVRRHHFSGGARVPRLDVPPRARLDRRLGVPVAGHHGHALLGPAWAAGSPRRRTSIVVRVDVEKNLLYISGAVPGARQFAREDRAFDASARRLPASDRTMAKLPSELEEGDGRRGRAAGRGLRLSVPPAPRLAGRQGLPRAARAPGTHKTKVRSRRSPAPARSRSSRRGPAGRGRAADVRRSTATAARSHGPDAALLRAGRLGRREEERPEGGALADGRARSASSSSTAWRSTATARGTLKAAIGGLGIEGKALFVDSREQRELRAAPRATCASWKLVDALAVNVYDVMSHGTVVVSRTRCRGSWRRWE